MFHVTPTQAELVKYTKNTFYAVKVIFANQMYDICQAMGQDWYTIRDMITAEQAQPIGPSHLDPIFGLNRGFGGKCLPKDSLALGVCWLMHTASSTTCWMPSKTDNAALAWHS